MATPAEADLSRRERRKLEVRERILTAAVELFDERGFDSVTVAEISQRADVAHKTLFNHFSSKQHLLREIAQEQLEQFLGEIEAVRKAVGTTRERLQILFGTLADNVEASGPMRRELLSEIIHAAHDSGTEPEQARRLQKAFGDVVRDGRAAGDVSRDHSVQTQTEAVLGSFYALMFNWVHLEGYPLRRRARAAARLLADALAARKERE